MIKSNNQSEGQNLLTCLKKLGFSSMEEFLSCEKIDYKNIYEYKYLSDEQISNLVEKVLSYSLSVPINTLQNKSEKIQMYDYPRLNNIFKLNMQFWSSRIIPQKIYEITGKSDSGKTFMCYQIIKEGLQKNIEVICFDSLQNFTNQKLLNFLSQKTLEEAGNKIKVYDVKTLHKEFKQLMIILHSCGNQLIKSRKNTLIIIDTLSTFIQGIPFEKHNSYCLELRKILSQITQKANVSIVFTTAAKVNLFDTIYDKNYEKRFRNRYGPIWDQLSDCTIVLESVLIFKEKRWMRIQRIALAKEIINIKVFERTIEQNE